MASLATHKAKSDTIRFALAMAKRPKYADGGVVGPLLDAGPGRTDTLPISVPAGAYVIPADCVSGLPGAQGNSLAGHNALTKMFASLPLSPDEAPYGSGSPKLARGRTIPGLASQHHLMASELDRARGGKAKKDEGGVTPIMAAGGEYVVPPEVVKRLGVGNLKRGHEILDQFVKDTRKRNIKELKKLPGPVTK